MKIAFFDSKPYEKESFISSPAKAEHKISFFNVRLNRETAKLANGYLGICSFVNDRLDAETLNELVAAGVKIIGLRSAGFNHVDLDAAKAAGIKVTRVPGYSPSAIAEYAVGMILTLNRKIHRAHNRVRELNFSLDDLVGFNLNGKTVGVVGTGRIGCAFARIMVGFGCKVLAYDLAPDTELSHLVEYVPLPSLLATSDIISLHLPLNNKTHHFVTKKELAKIKPTAMLVNTSRGGLIDTVALIDALKSKQIGSAALDVYEGEAGIFFCNLSESGLADDLLARLITFPNVLITPHSAFLTKEALANIASTTLTSFTAFEANQPLEFEL